MGILRINNVKSSQFANLVPRVSPLHAPGSERGETLVGAGHVSPREKLDQGRGPSPASLCQDLLSTPKRGFQASTLLHAVHAKLIQLAMIFSSLHNLELFNINLKAKQVRCLETLYFGKDVVAVLPKGLFSIFFIRNVTALAHEVLIVVSSYLNALMNRKIRSEEPRKET